MKSRCKIDSIIEKVYWPGWTLKGLKTGNVHCYQCCELHILETNLYLSAVREIYKAGKQITYTHLCAQGED